jgi:CRISPR-associated protein Cmr1
MSMANQPSGYSPPTAPKFNELPNARLRTARGSLDICTFSAQLEVVTPILGGSYQTRAMDDVDIIRAASVRGHLRFWWRALYASQVDELYESESALWGRAATDDGGRSAVEIRVEVDRKFVGDIDDNEIRLYDSRAGNATPGAYALWVARAERKKQIPTAPRRQPGTRFKLTVAVPATFAGQVRNALRAWILFGGYGGRTRRGLGSLRALDDDQLWLPGAATRNDIKRVFEFDVFDATTKVGGDTPLLAGAALHAGKTYDNAESAWTTALDWLKEFRQGTIGNEGHRAREPGTGKIEPSRPSISNWPEADKIRHIKGKFSAHTPKHNNRMAWPRAGFGLPIIGQFQTTGRRPGESYDEPGNFELRWRAGSIEHDRLASPLIVKALPLSNGKFAPCALWLQRGYPHDAKVGLTKDNKMVDRQTEAVFDLLVATDDTARFSALATSQTLRQAFLNWLQTRHRTTVVSP